MPKETFFNLPDEKREMITDLALRAFAEQGYRSVSISELVREAGIAKGSFYQYFEDKRDLYLYLLELVSREKAVFFAENPPPAADMDLFDYLLWLYGVGTRFEFRNPLLAKLGAQAISGEAPLSDDARKVLSGAARDFFLHLINRAQENGQLRPGLDPDLAAFLLDVIFSNVGDYILQRTGAVVPQVFNDRAAERFFTEVVDILRFGMADPSGV